MRKFYLSLGLIFIGNIMWAQLPDDFSDQLVSDNWDLVAGMTFDHNGQMYVWEKAGKVYVVDTNNIKSSSPVIDISEECANWRDHGLLGVTLDPNFDDNGYIYLFYAMDRHYLIYHGTPTYHPDSSITNQASIGRITRYTLDASTNYQSTVPNSRFILLGETITTGIPMLHESHSTGTIMFGSDGTLLCSTGDGHANIGEDIGGTDSTGAYRSQALADGIMTPDMDLGPYRSQYIGALNGKILRLDPATGDGVSSNPYYDENSPRSPQSRVWALGFRNPFRFAIVPNTGSHYPADGNPGMLIVGDVGKSNWEEINIVSEAGQNFGWPMVEGLIPYWGYWNKAAPLNYLAPNPLYGVNGCDKEFFTFKELYQLQKADGSTPVFANPCDPSQPIPKSLFPMIDQRPILTWNNLRWNPDNVAGTGGFDQNGNYSIIPLEDANSPVTGNDFDGFASIGGVFYQGGNFPEEYQNKYFHGDFSGWIRLLTFDDSMNLQSVEPFHTACGDVVTLVQHPSDGCIYYVNFDQEIRKICYGGNPPPIAVAKADTIYGSNELTVQFDGESSYDIFNLPISHSWDFGDGNSSSDINPSHTFTTTSTEPTSYIVTLTVTDSLGETGTDELIISLNNSPPKVNITSFEDGDFYPVERNFYLSLLADVEDAEHTNDELAYEWKIFLHHNDHFHPESPIEEQTSAAFISPVGCDGESYFYRIRLTVTDPEGLQSYDERSIFPHCGDDIVDWQVLDLVPSATSIELNWTVTENNTEFYVIQRSTDGKNFQPLAEIQATGLTNYTFTDLNPINGRNFYRIKALSPERVFSYSNTALQKYPIPPAVDIFPNPARDYFVLEFNQNAVQADFYLFDGMGQMVINQSWTTINETQQKTILTRKLQRGVYFFKVMIDNEVVTGKILVQ